MGFNDEIQAIQAIWLMQKTSRESKERLSRGMLNNRVRLTKIFFAEQADGRLKKGDLHLFVMDAGIGIDSYAGHYSADKIESDEMVPLEFIRRNKRWLEKLVFIILCDIGDEKVVGLIKKHFDLEFNFVNLAEYSVVALNFFSLIEKEMSKKFS